MSSTNEQKKLSDFLKEVEEENEVYRIPDIEMVERETLRAEFGEIYENYIVEGFTSGIESSFGGTNTAVKVTSPDGKKLTVWFGSYEEDHFLQKIKQWENNGNELPVEISFVRIKETSEKSGREYNRLKIKTVAVGEEVQLKLDAL